MTRPQEVFGTVEVARLLSVAPATVVNWIDAGRIPAYRTPGGHRRVRREDLAAFIEESGFPMPAGLGKRPRTILVVDDDPAVREVLVAAFEELAREPLEIHTAADGTTGLIEVGRRRPDVLILDIFMPRMDGFEVCRRIRRHGEISPLIVAVSGNRSHRVRAEALAAGADYFFAKPLPLEEVVRTALAGPVPAGWTE